MRYVLIIFTFYFSFANAGDIFVSATISADQNGRHQSYENYVYNSYIRIARADGTWLNHDAIFCEGNIIQKCSISIFLEPGFYKVIGKSDARTHSHVLVDGIFKLNILGLEPTEQSYFEVRVRGREVYNGYNNQHDWSDLAMFQVR